MIALKNLNNVSDSLSTTQKRISTGLNVIFVLRICVVLVVLDHRFELDGTEVARIRDKFEAAVLMRAGAKHQAFTRIESEGAVAAGTGAGQVSGGEVKIQ